MYASCETTWQQGLGPLEGRVDTGLLVDRQDALGPCRHDFPRDCLAPLARRGHERKVQVASTDRRLLGPETRRHGLGHQLEALLLALLGEGQSNPPPSSSHTVAQGFNSMGHHVLALFQRNAKELVDPLKGVSEHRREPFGDRPEEVVHVCQLRASKEDPQDLADTLADARVGPHRAGRPERESPVGVRSAST